MGNRASLNVVANRKYPYPCLELNPSHPAQCLAHCEIFLIQNMRVYQKFLDWLPGVRTANGTALATRCSGITVF
jgi:hypothetical protein